VNSPQDCPQLKALINQIEGNCIPARLRGPVEQHLEECRTCRAGLINFLKIDKILEKTVYSETKRDNVLRYVSSLVGRKLAWDCSEESREKQRRKIGLLLLRIIAGCIAAGGLGASIALLLGHFGIIGGGRPAEDSGPPVELTTPGPWSPAPIQADREAADESAEAQIPVVVPAGGLDPEAVYRYLDSFSRSAARARAAADSASPADSTRLQNLEAELGALRDALARTPQDGEIRRRTMDKYREIIDERKRMGRSLRVRDYYNLGYLHYLGGEFPQTAIITREGLLMVRIGPTQYLHYLKAMSHYQIGLRALNPLPPDTSATPEARVAGETMRAGLDAAARKRAAMEFRRAIGEFSNLLSNPDLEPSARQWILECNAQLGKAAAPQ